MTDNRETRQQMVDRVWLETSEAVQRVSRPTQASELEQVISEGRLVIQWSRDFGDMQPRAVFFVGGRMQGTRGIEQEWLN